MWKVAVGFVVFAAIAIFVIMKGGENVDMGGEKHGEVAPVAVEASAASGAASAASAAASGASAASY